MMKKMRQKTNGRKSQGMEKMRAAKTNEGKGTDEENYKQKHWMKNMLK